MSEKGNVKDEVVDQTRNSIKATKYRRKYRFPLKTG